MGEEHIIGSENSPTFTKASLKAEKDMEEVPSGGVTEVGTKDNSDKACKAAVAVSIETEV